MPENKYTQQQLRGYDKYMRAYEAKEAKDPNNVRIVLSLNSFVQMRKDVAAKNAARVAKGLKPITHITDYIIGTIDRTSNAQASTLSKAATEYIGNLSEEAKAKLIAKNPELSKYIDLSQRQLYNRLKRDPNVKEELFKYLPNKRKRNTNSRGYHYVAVWIDS